MSINVRGIYQKYWKISAAQELNMVGNLLLIKTLESKKETKSMSKHIRSKPKIIEETPQQHINMFEPQSSQSIKEEFRSRHAQFKSIVSRGKKGKRYTH